MAASTKKFGKFKTINVNSTKRPYSMKFFFIVPQSKVRLSLSVERVENRIFYPRQESDRSSTRFTSSRVSIIDMIKNCIHDSWNRCLSTLLTQYTISIVVHNGVNFESKVMSSKIKMTNPIWPTSISPNNESIYKKFPLKKRTLTPLGKNKEKWLNSIKFIKYLKLPSLAIQVTYAISKYTKVAKSLDNCLFKKL